MPIKLLALALTKERPQALDRKYCLDRKVCSRHSSMGSMSLQLYTT
jgi:hypothetical protein